MAFMQKQVELGTYFSVETTVGTEIVPTDVIGRTVATHVEALLNYLEGNPLDDEETCEVRTGWLARWYAPGYPDCTPWTAFQSERAAHAYLDESDEDDTEDQEQLT